MIRKIVVSTGAVTTLAGSTTPGYTDGKGNAAQFYYPTDVACDRKGNLYVIDQNNNMIRKIVISTGVVSTLAGNTSNRKADGIGIRVHFTNPYGITYDVAGNLCVTDSGNQRIRKIVISTGVVTTLSSSGSWSSTVGMGIAASLYYSSGITSDGKGNLYVAYLGSYKIRKIVISTGKVRTLAGSGNNGSIDGIGTAPASQFHWYIL